MLGFTEKEAWRKTPYQITKLFRYHKEFNPHQFRNETRNEQLNGMDDIDIALGGL